MIHATGYLITPDSMTRPSAQARGWGGGLRRGGAEVLLHSLASGGRFAAKRVKIMRLGCRKKLPDYALSSAIKVWYKTGTCGCFCGFERWRATRCNFKRGSARPSLLFFMEQRISAGRR